MRQTSNRRTQREHAIAIRGHHSRPYQAPPAPGPGQVACPVCRKPVTPLASGFLRQHADLFGLKCYNRRPPEAGA